MNKSIDIFIKSYKDDFWILYYALASIEKNVTGYNNVILLIPEKDKEEFDTRVLPLRTLVHYVEDKTPGWLYQQVCKLNAHRYSFADYIMFSDSDCIFTRKVNVQDYIKDDKPEILYTEWQKVGDAIVWKEPTELFLFDSVPYEFMRRNNQLVHKSTLVEISKYKPNLEEIIMGSGSFSEFNCIGAFAYKYEKDKYTFINTDDWTYVPPIAEQLWSHSSKAAGVSEVHLREFIRTIETILKAMTGIEITDK